MAEKMLAMMVRGGNKVSKSAARNTFNLWMAVTRVDMSVAGKVTLDASDYGTIYKYAQACAKAAGVIP